LWHGVGKGGKDNYPKRGEGPPYVSTRGLRDGSRRQGLATKEARGVTDATSVAVLKKGKKMPQALVEHSHLEGLGKLIELRKGKVRIRRRALFHRLGAVGSA